MADKPQGDYGSHDDAGYADPGYQADKKPRYPLKDGGKYSEERIRSAWNYINKRQNAGSYSAGDLKKIKDRIVSAWRAHIDKAGPPGAMARFSDTAAAHLKAVEIFAAGRWPGSGVNGYRFTIQDLDDLVNSFSALGLSGRVPIKLGHDDDDYANTDGEPALGWVDRVWRDNDKLMADITLVSPKLAGLIQDQAYKFVSVELLHNVQADTRQIPWVLDAVALLGASPPAVGVLKDLQASLRMSHGSGLRTGTRMAPRRAAATFTGARNRMAQGDNDSDEGMSSDQVQALIDKAMEPHKKAVKDLQDQLTAATKAKQASDIKAHRAGIVNVFEVAIAAGKVNPAARERFSKTFGVDDDTRVMAITEKDATDYIESVKDLPQFKGQRSTGAGKSRVGFSREEIQTANGTAAEYVTALTEERMRKNGDKLSDYQARERAMFSVLREQPALAKQYWADPNAEYQEAAA